MFLKELILSEIFGQLWNFPRINWIFIDWLMAHVNLTSTQTKEKINYKFKSLPFNFVLFESSSLNKFIPLRLIFYSSDKVSKIINKWKKKGLNFSTSWIWYSLSNTTFHSLDQISEYFWSNTSVLVMDVERVSKTMRISLENKTTSHTKCMHELQIKNLIL